MKTAWACDLDVTTMMEVGEQGCLADIVGADVHEEVKISLWGPDPDT